MIKPRLSAGEHRSAYWHQTPSSVRKLAAIAHTTSGFGFQTSALKHPRDVINQEDIQDKIFYFAHVIAFRLISGKNHSV